MLDVIMFRCLCRVLVVLTALMATLHCASALRNHGGPAMARIVEHIPEPPKKKTHGHICICKLESTIQPVPSDFQPQSLTKRELSFAKDQSCFHFFVSRNMSALLSNATKRLRQVKDKHEREWLLTFIYKIKSLAEHLRFHPETRNYHCLPESNEERMISPSSGDELYFEDSPMSETTQISLNKAIYDFTKSPPLPSSLLKSGESDNKISTTSSVTQAIMHESQSPPTVATSTEGGHSAEQTDKRRTYTANKDDSLNSDIVVEDWPEKEYAINDDLVQEIPAGYELHISPNLIPGAPDSLRLGPEIYRLHVADKPPFKEETLQSILADMSKQIKRLRALGGTEADLAKIWKLSEERSRSQGRSSGDGSEATQSSSQENLPVDENDDEDFDEQETGAAAGELEAEDKSLPKERTVAPSLEVLNSKEHVDGNGRAGSSSHTDSEEYNDNSDDSDPVRENYDDSDESHDDSNDELVQQLLEGSHVPRRNSRFYFDENGKRLTSKDSILVFD